MKRFFAVTTLLIALSPVLNVPVALADDVNSNTSTPVIETTNEALEQAPAMPSYKDIPDENKYFESVRNITKLGFMKGDSTNNFRINSFVTRDDVIYAIAKAANLKPNNVNTQIFRDIRKNNPAFKEITAASEDDLLDAFVVKKNMFSPKAKVTVAQALDALYKAFDADEFSGEVELRYELKTELPDNWDFTTDVRRAVKDNVLFQKADGTLYLDPTKNITRGDFASLLYRFTESRKEGIGFGLASWYGDGLSKVKVTGDRAKELSAKHLTAANRDLPMGTILKVTNQYNGKSVEVAVNDRGPYVAGRVVDLSRSAFAAIEDVGTGTAVVKIEVIQKTE